MAGRPISWMAAWRETMSLTGAKGATSRPQSTKKCFSRRRSCAVAMARALGKSGRSWRTCASMFSLSMVRRSTLRANSATACGELRSTGRMGATCSAQSPGRPAQRMSAWMAGAASASMRASWPAPRMPTRGGRFTERFPQGLKPLFLSAHNGGAEAPPLQSGALCVEENSCAGVGVGEDGFGLVVAEGFECGGDANVSECEDGRGEEAGVLCAGVADGEGGDGHAAGHLHDGEERVDAVERVRLDGDAEDREAGFCGDHAGEVCGAAGSGDDDADTTRLGCSGVVEHAVRRAVRGDDLGFVGDGELGEDVGGVLEGGPVGARAHDDADEGSGFWLRQEAYLRG